MAASDGFNAGERAVESAEREVAMELGRPMAARGAGGATAGEAVDTRAETSAFFGLLVRAAVGDFPAEPLPPRAGPTVLPAVVLR